MEKKYLRIPKKEAWIIKNLDNVIEKNGRIVSDARFVFVPIVCSEENYRKIEDLLNNSEIMAVSENELSPELKLKVNEIIKKNNLKDLLRESFDDKEINKIKSSYDIVGDIAIIEIDKEFLDKKEIIGNAILKSNPHVKTVLMKKGKHKGVFRIQKYDYVCGENKLETMHKENGILLKLKVDEAYFSVRMGSERKRILKQVKKQEDVLVMFSGIGPYSIEIAKKTSARTVYGVELNPNGQKYSIINKFLNKAWNFLPILGDVKKVAKSFYSYSFGLKSSLEQKELNVKLNNQINPDFAVIELMLRHEDLANNVNETHNIKNLLSTIDRLKSLGKNISLHMPMPFRFKPLRDYLAELKMLGKIAKEKQCLIVVHLPPKEIIKKNEQLRIVLEKFSDYFYYENLITQEFLTTCKDFLEFKDFVKNVCVDISHLGLVLRTMDKVKYEIEKFRDNFNCYFHLNNYYKKKDSFDLDKGELNINELSDMLTFGVVEVRNRDENLASEMLNSFKWISKKKKTFDRILMPLPKDGEHFLDDALSLIKDEGIIHFYDFLHEKDFDRAIQKIKNACEENSFNFKILNFVKCGQHSPRTFRICVDFQVFKV